MFQKDHHSCNHSLLHRIRLIHLWTKWCPANKRENRTPCAFSIPKTEPRPITPRGAGRGAGAQHTDLQAGLAGAGDCWADPAGASGDWSAEQDLCACSAKTGLKKSPGTTIIKYKKSAPPYSEERREAARKFARKHNTIEKLK